MNLEHSAEYNGGFRAEFSSEEWALVRRIAQEGIDMAMRQDHSPNPSDQYLLDRAVPEVVFNSADTLHQFTGKVAQFVDDTGYQVVQRVVWSAGYLPSQVVRLEAAQREVDGEAAAALQFDVELHEYLLSLNEASQTDN